MRQLYLRQIKLLQLTLEYSLEDYEFILSQLNFRLVRTVDAQDVISLPYG